MNYVLTGLLSFAFLLSAGAGGYRQYTYRFGDHFPPTTFEGNVVHRLQHRLGTAEDIRFQREIFL